MYDVRCTLKLKESAICIKTNKCKSIASSSLNQHLKESYERRDYVQLEFAFFCLLRITQCAMHMQLDVDTNIFVVTVAWTRRSTVCARYDMGT